MESSISRQLKIDLITDTPNPIIEWFISIWYKLYVVERNVMHCNGGEMIYYINGDVKKCIFFRDDRRGIFRCDFTNFWTTLELSILGKSNDYILPNDYTECQVITKILVEYLLGDSSTIAQPAYRNISFLIN